jgi:hypothetical protein
MNTVKIIQLAGLLFGATGLWLIFMYGISPILKEHEYGDLYVHLNDDDRNMDVKRVNKSKRLAFIGLLFSLFSFALQFIAVLFS